MPFDAIIKFFNLSSFDGLADLDQIVKEYKDHCYSEKDPYNCYLYIWERDYLTLITKKLKRSGTNFASFTVEENTKLTDEENKLIGNEHDVVVGDNSKTNATKLEEAISTDGRKTPPKEVEDLDSPNQELADKDSSQDSPEQEDSPDQEKPTTQNLIGENSRFFQPTDADQVTDIETEKPVEKKKTKMSELKALNHQYLAERGILPESGPESGGLNVSIHVSSSDEEKEASPKLPKVFANAEDAESDRIMSGMFANFARKKED